MGQKKCFPGLTSFFKELFGTDLCSCGIDLLQLVHLQSSGVMRWASCMFDDLLYLFSDFGHL